MRAAVRERKLRVMTTLQLQEHLQSLSAERYAAALVGLDRDDLYLRDLQEEIEATHSAYVGAAVTEIATFRAELSGALQG
jgi:hypothetical protein